MFKNMLFIFLLVLYAFVPVPGEFAPSSTEDASTEGRDNMNVVLFLAHTDSGCNYEKQDGIAYLNISAVGKIKPCTLRPESNVPRNIGSIIRRSQRKECDCKKLLESSIFSLMGWARNAMGMTTAIVSLTNNEKVMGEEKGASSNNPKFQVADSVASKGYQQRENPAYMEVHNKEDFGQLPLPKYRTTQNDDLPNIKKDINLMEQNIPILNAYSHEPKLKFNDIHKYHNKFGDFVNVRRVKRKLIVEPENTQVFEIAAVNEEPNEIMNIPSLEKSGRPESIWELLGIMSAIKRSFFINFLNPMLDPHQRMLDEENGINFNSLGQVRTPSLFQLVKRTLHKLQEDTKESRASGFLLVVFGGSLSDISEPYSDLVQSIKQVRETTDAKNTLVTVTGCCPENHANKTPHVIKNNGEFVLPVYAEGPNADMLRKARELFDIPVQIKQAIEGGKSMETNLFMTQKNDLETANQNRKFLDVNNVDAIENPFDKIGRQNNEVDGDEKQFEDKWSNMRKKRNVLKSLPVIRNKSTKLILNKLIFIVILTYLFTM